MEPLSESGTVPLDLVAGMKHSGKTSFINALLRGLYRGQNVIVFTNEIGNTDYDENVRVHTVLGGCICCTAQAALISEIRNALWFEAPDHLIVELSGKGTIRDMLSIFSYLPDCRLHQVVYVLNACKFQAMATVMGSGFSGEIRTAPVLFLNRWKDLCREDQDAIQTQIDQWNPSACILTDYPNAPFGADYSACRLMLPDRSELGATAHTAFRFRPADGSPFGMKAFFREKAVRKPR